MRESFAQGVLCSVYKIGFSYYFLCQLNRQQLNMNNMLFNADSQLKLLLKSKTQLKGPCKENHELNIIFVQNFFIEIFMYSLSFYVGVQTSRWYLEIFLIPI